MDKLSIPFSLFLFVDDPFYASFLLQTMNSVQLHTLSHSVDKRSVVREGKLNSKEEKV